MFRFCDGVDSYTADGDVLAKGWAMSSSWDFDSNDGINGGGAFKTTAAAGVAVLAKQYRAASGAITRTYASFWVKFSAAPAVSSPFFRAAHNGGSDAIHGLCVSTGGFLALSVGTGSVANISAVQIADNVFHHIEVYVHTTLNGLSSTVTSYADGVLVHSAISVSSVIANVGADGVRFYSVDASTLFTLDDIVIWDNEGSGMTTFPQGVTMIETIRPTAAGDSTQFTPNSGDNYAAVDEVASDGATSYNLAATAGFIDLYNFGNLVATPVSVKGVAVSVVEKPTTPGTCNSRAKAKSSATVADGTTIAVSGAGFRTDQHAFLVDPNTAAAWGAAGINAAQFGVELVS